MITLVIDTVDMEQESEGMTITKAEMERVEEIATAHTYLTTAKHSVDYARMRLNHTDVEIEEELWEAYDILDKLLIKLRKEMYKEVKG